MAAWRLFLSRSLLFRTQRRVLPSSSSLTSTPLTSLRFFTTSSSADFSGVEDDSAAASHLWPEWDLFLGKLRTKGYFEIASSEGDNGGIAVPDDSVEVVENACLRFARERLDILRSLPKEDIQVVVECGCPNLFRKVVNSAKRLRAFLKLDEGDVCSACNLKNSCDNAYVIATEDEAARTVDIMRILFSYAINPAVPVAEENPVKVQVEESARKLISELIKLSDTTLDPSLPKPSMLTTIMKNLPQNTEMKKGDWLCSRCNFLNFARNIRCLECKADGPKRVDFGGISEEMKPGDWTCPKCQFMNFARNTNCMRCKDAARPKRHLNPGEWECPSCDFFNFRRNMVCKKCNRERPDNKDFEFRDHTRKPEQVSRAMSFKFGDEDSDDVGEDYEDYDGKDDVNRSTNSQRLMSLKEDIPQLERGEIPFLNETKG